MHKEIIDFIKEQKQGVIDEESAIKKAFSMAFADLPSEVIDSLPDFYFGNKDKFDYDFLEQLGKVMPANAKIKFFDELNDRPPNFFLCNLFFDRDKQQQEIFLTICKEVADALMIKPLFEKDIITFSYLAKLALKGQDSHLLIDKLNKKAEALSSIFPHWTELETKPPLNCDIVYATLKRYFLETGEQENAINHWQVKKLFEELSKSPRAQKFLSFHNIWLVYESITAENINKLEIRIKEIELILPKWSDFFEDKDLGGDKGDFVRHFIDSYTQPGPDNEKIASLVPLSITKRILEFGANQEEKIRKVILKKFFSKQLTLFLDRLKESAQNDYKRFFSDPYNLLYLILDGEIIEAEKNERRGIDEREEASFSINYKPREKTGFRKKFELPLGDLRKDILSLDDNQIDQLLTSLLESPSGEEMSKRLNFEKNVNTTQESDEKSFVYSFMEIPEKQREAFQQIIQELLNRLGLNKALKKTGLLFIGDREGLDVFLKQKNYVKDHKEDEHGMEYSYKVIPNLGGVIVIDKSRLNAFFNGDEKIKARFLCCVLHEIGHAIGLGVVSENPEIMATLRTVMRMAHLLNPLADSSYVLSRRRVLEHYNIRFFRQFCG